MGLGEKLRRVRVKFDAMESLTWVREVFQNVSLEETGFRVIRESVLRLPIDSIDVDFRPIFMWELEHLFAPAPFNFAPSRDAQTSEINFNPFENSAVINRRYNVANYFPFTSTFARRTVALILAPPSS